MAAGAEGAPAGCMCGRVGRRQYMDGRKHVCWGRLIGFQGRAGKDGMLRQDRKSDPSFGGAV
eukprot:86806-Chlamydomonas_euryale.AAC.1